jgi:hypothetical protein
VGRRHLIPLAAFVAALSCVPAATAGTHVSRLLQGKTEASGSHKLHVYAATQQNDLGTWVRRLTPTHQARVRAVDLDKTILVAGFLDGNACSFDLRLKRVTFTHGRLTIEMTFRRPPIGAATCVRTSTSYVVLAFGRAELGRLPTLVELRTVART